MLKEFRDFHLVIDIQPICFSCVLKNNFVNDEWPDGPKWERRQLEIFALDFQERYVSDSAVSKL